MTTEQQLYPVVSVIALVTAAILLVFAYVIGSWFYALLGAIELAIAIYYGVKWVKLRIEYENG